MLACNENYALFLKEFDLDAHLISIGDEHINMLHHIFDLLGSVFFNLELHDFRDEFSFIGSLINLQQVREEFNYFL